jgi:putative glycosyltransferase (TIGR04372 family)
MSKIFKEDKKNRLKKISIIIKRIPKYFFAFLINIIIRLIRPWILIRMGELQSTRIGHFCANTELYLCKLDKGLNKPKIPYVDIFYMTEPICNRQLAKMWKRLIHIWPKWLVSSTIQVNRMIFKGECYEVKQDACPELDTYNLLDTTKTHLKFTLEEEERGEKELLNMGIPINAEFICLNVRDSAYLAEHIPEFDWSYHNYRDSNIENYIMAAEELANKGYYIIRMGAKVNSRLMSKNRKIIDYATNGMRNDFMDIYLGSKCKFCITTGSGWDAVPEMFRRPIVYVNMVPLVGLHTFSTKFLSITKHHISKLSRRKLTMSEIFEYDVGYCMSSLEYESRGIELEDNTPAEIFDVVMEMEARLSGNWIAENQIDDELQTFFWNKFQSLALNGKYDQKHGNLKSKFGSKFLRENRNYVE